MSCSIDGSTRLASPRDRLRARVLAAACALLVGGACNTEKKDGPAASPAPGSSASPATPSAPSPAQPTQPPAPSTGLPPQTVGAEADCSRYSVAAIESVWGPGVQPPAPGGSNKVRPINGPDNYQWTCQYHYDDSNGLTVAVESRVWATEEEAKRDFASSRSGEEMLAKRAPQAVAAGDEAFVASPAAKDVNRQIYVRKGRVKFLLSATNLKGTQPDYTEKLIKTFELR